MGKFAVPKWDSTDVADEMCNKLFKGTNKITMKGKLKNSGKIVKAKLNKAKVEINKKLAQSIENNLVNVKNAVNKKKNKLLKKQNQSKKGTELLETSMNNNINSSKKKLNQKKKKVSKLQNLPNFKHMKNVIETKLSNEDDQQMLFSQDSISESSCVNTENKKNKRKKKKVVDSKTDISKKIESDIAKVKQKKKKLNKKIFSETEDLDVTLESNSGESTAVVENKSSKQKKKKLNKNIFSETEDLDVTLESNSEDTTAIVGNKNRKGNKSLSLRERMLAKLKASRFRYLNEQLYLSPSNEAQNFFKSDPDSFKAYHEGFRQQVDKWPINPVDVIIESIKKMNKTHVIADFGCGDAKIAQEVPQKVHSFDLVATNERVTACDMAKVPLNKESVDVAVFCLSLMGTNLHDYLKEACRVLKIGGILKIAEVESRFDNVDDFIKGVQSFGFKNTQKDLSHNIFYFIDFKKTTNIKKTKGLPTLSLHPCMYKKR
ncbi:ribosomal RNA-processing protein 8 [Harmonia axyridis]|uniref:ribosomal RNA-processing protein 8 n=1 Tax=Harmonia axyridis TaxID=115357 RepID=UPI001E279683|nr:ribosomal RNA-processing protein 8 [Harmonia axyridis]